jgi:hypothetical protein
MNSSAFDQRFEAGDSLIVALDLTAARRPRQEQKRVNVDSPLWMVEQLDREASRLGVTRQSILKVWLAERLERRIDASGSALTDEEGSGLGRQPKGTTTRLAACSRHHGRWIESLNMSTRLHASALSYRCPCDGRN